MKFCRSCGNKLEDNVKFCPNCGELMNENSIESDLNSSQENGSIADSTATTYETVSEQKDAEDNKLMGILAYILFFIPLIVGPKDSKFVKYHTNQGFVLFITAIAWVIIEKILSSILVAIFVRVPFVWALFSILLWVLSLVTYVFAALAIIGIINVVNGQKKPLPVIGGFQILK